MEIKFYSKSRLILNNITTELYDKLIRIIDNTKIAFCVGENNGIIINNSNEEIKSITYHFVDSYDETIEDNGSINIIFNYNIHSIDAIITNIIIDLNNKNIIKNFLI